MFESAGGSVPKEEQLQERMTKEKVLQLLQLYPELNDIATIVEVYEDFEKRMCAVFEKHSENKTDALNMMAQLIKEFDSPELVLQFMEKLGKHDFSNIRKLIQTQGVDFRLQ